MTPSAVVCPICPHVCCLEPGATGACHARQNQNGVIVPLGEGRPCAVSIDPMEKKPLFHFFPGTEILSLGMAGCNLHCKNCQNADISQQSPCALPFRELPAGTLPALMRRAGQKSVAYTYTEPLVAFEYVLECARHVRESGGYNVLVSAAYVQPGPLKRLLPFIDAANIDLKSMSDAFYRSNCGASLKPILEALRIMREFPVSLEITNLVIPVLNDRETDFLALVRFVRDALGPDTPLHFSRFFPKNALTHLPPTPESTLLAAQSIARAEGLCHVYLGNTSQPEITFCASCHKALIRRDGYRVTFCELTSDGSCPSCHSPLYGRF